MINGIIIVDKPQGFTSHDVVAKLRGICGQRKIGHTGTLDPLATGVLPVCLGSATKLCDLLTEKKKEYVADLLLGISTDTQDITGQVLGEKKVDCTTEQFMNECIHFVGHYDQIPPMYSALKVNGKKLYELAREGKEVERKARPVEIYELEVLHVELPRAQIRVVCSKGTYIRTLVSDLGDRLGCGATMEALRRTASGTFTLEKAYSLDSLQRKKDEGTLIQSVLPVDSVFCECPAVHVTGQALKMLENGNALYPGQLVENAVYPAGEWLRVYRPDDSFAGIYAFDEGKKRYQPIKMFLEKE